MHVTQRRVDDSRVRKGRVFGSFSSMRPFVHSECLLFSGGLLVEDVTVRVPFGIPVKSTMGYEYGSERSCEILYVATKKKMRTRARIA